MLSSREHAVGNTEDRFIDIEIKLAHQEHIVESLNQRVYEQQQQIDKLEQMIARARQAKGGKS